MKSRGLLVLVFAVLLTLHAQGTEFDVANGSKVSFKAKITAGSFTGTSEKLEGSVSYDEETHKLESAAFSLPVDSIDTGLSLRNQHMREKYMESGKFPHIQFRSENKLTQLHPGTETVVPGILVIKDREKPVLVRLKVEDKKPAPPRASANFDVNILDFGIPQPTMAVVKMEPVVEVAVDLVLKRK